MKWLIAIVVFLAASRLEAATIYAASASYTDVNTACNTTAARGDTVMVTNTGTVAWGSTLTLTKGIKLVGPGRDSLTITRSGVHVHLNPDATAISNEEQMIVDGFTFDGNDSALNIIEMTGAGAAGTKPAKNLVVRNCRIRDSGTTTSGSGALLMNGQIRGLASSNIFDRVNVLVKYLGNDDTAEFENSAYTNFAYGSADNFFFEGNVMTNTTTSTCADPFWIETGQGSRIVCRYNQYYGARCTMQEVWDIHGFQNFPGGQTGTMLVEYYGNSGDNMSAYRWINHRGNPGIFHNNIFTGSGAMDIEINQYASGDSGGSGCEADVPGSFLTSVRDTYTFNNTFGGTVYNMTPGSPIGDGCGTAENSSWYNYNASFNGTTGIGRGTSTPGGTCTTGVGYWKATTATPTTDPAVIQAGTFYKATATDTWTAYYTPYTFPHPLAADAAAGGGSSYTVNIGTLRITKP